MSTATIEQTQAVQWFKNGDHPHDGVGEPRTDPVTGEIYLGIEGAVVRFFRNPDVFADAECVDCGQRPDVHGWIDAGDHGHKVCPGDYIVQDADGNWKPVKSL